jgi:two-component system, OmpR family, response regulator
MRLLVVEDEPKMARMLQQGLSEEGHLVDVCTRGSDAEAQARAVAYDVIVLDWGLPDEDGVAWLRRQRDAGVSVPVLMLTARGTLGERVTGLRAGADDYLVKPFDFEELLARLEALARRGSGRALRPRFRSAELDTTRRMLRGPSGEVELTAREFALGLELFSHAGEVLTRSRLLGSVWGSGHEHTLNVVDVYVGYVRAKLAQVGVADCEIATVRGMGYRLVAKDGPA